MKLPGVAILALLLAACSALDSAAPGLARAGEGRAAADELALYLGELHGMSEARRASEAARQRELAARTPGDVARVKAALALTLVPHADDAEILALVEPVAAGGKTPEEVRAMASFLQAIATERRRLRESAAAAGTRLREERRAREQEKQRADALQERAAHLQQKLDALSELEKSLSDRQPSR
jgi:chromosome segregation ATPase